MMEIDFAADADIAAVDMPDYLQQLEMESNGKRIDRAGNPVGYATAPVIFGNVGANSRNWVAQAVETV